MKGSGRSPPCSRAPPPFGEREAAAAIERVKKAIDLTAKVEKPVEYRFNLPDDWKRRLFSALSRRYGLEPYRYRRQRYTTVMLKVPKIFRRPDAVAGVPGTQ